MRVALYGRVSTHSQDQSESIETQRYYLEEWAKSNGHTVTGWYGDGDVRSAVPIAERPEGARLLRDAARGEFDLVAIYSISRWSRYSQVWLEGRQALQAHGVDLVCLRGEVRDETPSDRLALGVNLVVTEYERDQIRQTCLDGRYRRASEGGYVGGAVLYGYRVAGDRRRYFEINEEEAQVVRQVFRWVADEGLSSYRVAVRLSALGVSPPSRSGGNHLLGENRGTSAQWWPCKITQMIRHPGYVGQATYGGKVSGRGPVPMGMPAIVEPALAERARARLANNKSLLAHPGHRYLLSGFVECGECGAPMYGQSHRRKCNPEPRRYYLCRTKFRFGQKWRAMDRGCSMPGIRAESAEQIVWRLFYNTVRDLDATMRALTDQARRDVDRLAEVVRYRDQLLAARARTGDNRRRAVQLATDGLITRQDLEDQFQRIREAAEALDERIEAAEHEYRMLSDMDRAIETARQELQAWHGKMEFPTWELQRRALETFTRAAILRRDGGPPVLVFRFGVGGMLNTLSRRCVQHKSPLELVLTGSLPL